MMAVAAGSERALILAPYGRDAQVAASILAEAGMETEICADLLRLQSACLAGAGLALIVEEALQEQDYGPLARWIEGQPAWSDFPVIVLAPRGAGLERNGPGAATSTGGLGFH